MDIREELKKGPIILDDILPLELSESFKKQVYETAYFRLGDLYTGTSGISNDFIKENNLKNLYEQFQFSENFVHSPTNEVDFRYYHLYTLPLTIAYLRLNLVFDLDCLYRCKLNFQTRAPEMYKGKYNWPHVDIDDMPEDVGDDYLTALYYVNDSDGDTYFFNETNVRFKDIDKINSLTIRNQVSPKQGRIVLFSIKDLHAGANPIKNDFRMVINYNLKIGKSIRHGIIENKLRNQYLS